MQFMGIAARHRRSLLLCVTCLLVVTGIAPQSAPTASVPLRIPVASASLAVEYTIYLPHIISVAPVPSSAELIEAARARGEIDSETALIYQVYAVFADDRLPEQFWGDDSEVTDSLIMDEVAEQFATLSPQSQVLLQPFFIPPAYPGSWTDRRDPPSQRAAASMQQPLPTPLPKEGWTNISRPGGDVKVWWQTRFPSDKKRAETVLFAMDEIWSDLTTLMQQFPDSDHDRQNNGGDGLFDIYLYEKINDLVPSRRPGTSVVGVAMRYEPTCQSPPYIVLDPVGVSDENLLATAAHEFMHALQRKYVTLLHCNKYHWLSEATATWAEDYVFPTSIGNLEHKRAKRFFTRPEVPLDDQSQLYNNYVFPFYLAGEQRARAHLIRVIWEQTEQYNSFGAINAALEGAGLKGLKELWPKFAIANRNRGPVDDYQRWDGLAGGVQPALANALDGTGNRFTKIDLEGRPDRTFALTTTLNPMSAVYYHFRFDDPAAREVAFYNPFDRDDDTTIAVQALIKRDGAWQPLEDWSDILPPHYNNHHFCRDFRTERIEELVIILSNSDWQTRKPKLAPEAPMLTMSNVGCARWVGQAKVTVSYYDDQTGNQYVETTTITDLVFEQTTRRSGGGLLCCDLVAGKARWHHEGFLGGYTGNGDGEYAVVPEEVLDGFIIYSLVGDNSYRTFDGFYMVPPDRKNYSILYTDANGHSYLKSGVTEMWLNTDPGTKVSPDGQTIVSTYTETEDQVGLNNVTITWELSLHSQPDP